MKQENVEVLKKAIFEYGVHNQINMCVEECAELIQAINKYKRGSNIYLFPIKPNDKMPVKEVILYHKLCGEIADVEIMIEQMKMMFDDEIINIISARKIARLKKRLDKK